MSTDTPMPARLETSQERRLREAAAHNAARAGHPNLVTSEILSGFAIDVNSRATDHTNLVTFWSEMAERINAHVLRGAA